MGKVGNADNRSSHMLFPPRKNAFGDHMLWIEEVSDWTVNVKAFAQGGDRKDKGIVACYELTLY